MDIETSQTQDPVDVTGTEAASSVEHVNETRDNNANDATPEANAPTEAEETLAEKMKAAAAKKGGDKGVDVPAEGKEEKPGDKPQDAVKDVVQNEPPKYEPNFKYKAFGKEKELDPFFRDLVKDPESERKVKEVFTRADAFDDMKGRYEAASIEGQKTLQQFTALDRDVRRVTSFLNSGDTDNFFRALNIPDSMLLEHLQRKAEIQQLSPDQQRAYNQGIDARAQNLYAQETYEQLKQNYATQQVEYRQMQLDSVLLRPEVNSAASAWDQKMGLGAFRNLVIEEGANVVHATGQDLPAEMVVQRVLQKYGKLLQSEAPQPAPQNSQPQASPQPQPSAPQAPQTVVVQGKPVIPNVNGRGTSPVKQAPKSLDELRKLGAQARMAEAQYQEANF